MVQCGLAMDKSTKKRKSLKVSEGELELITGMEISSLKDGARSKKDNS